MTEHDRGFSGGRLGEFRQACAAASVQDLLVVPGIEYSDALNRVHVLVWGPVPFLGEAMPTRDMLRAVHAANGVAVLAHPSRKDAWKCFDPDWANLLTGIEVWNRKTDGWAPSRTAPALLSESLGAVPFVGMDFHTRRQSFPLAMMVELEGEVTEDALLNSLRSRRCHARALGMRLRGGLLERAQPVLDIAELGRRSAARIVRRPIARTQ